MQVVCKLVLTTLLGRGSHQLAMHLEFLARGTTECHVYINVQLEVSGGFDGGARALVSLVGLGPDFLANTFCRCNSMDQKHRFRILLKICKECGLINTVMPSFSMSALCALAGLPVVYMFTLFYTQYSYHGKWANSEVPMAWNGCKLCQCVTHVVYFFNYAASQ